MTKKSIKELTNEAAGILMPMEYGKQSLIEFRLVK